MKLDAPPSSFRKLFDEQTGEAFQLLADPRLQEVAKEYRPWRTFRHIARDRGLDPVLAWKAIKIQRLQSFRSFPTLIRHEGGTFGIHNSPLLGEALHRIDRITGGGGPTTLMSDHGALADDEAKTRFRIRTLMDEAAESSLIEGAATTRKEAVELLRTGRDPKTKGERMVVNNYMAMQQIKQWIKQPLSTDMLLELQSILTEGTLEQTDEQGRFRRADERVRVSDRFDNEIIHTPPPADQIHVRLRNLCEFANREHTGDEFLHPIIKACILHFMIGYEHPFCDGNGRTARAVFYWYALRHGYSIFEYMTISDLIRKGYAQYPQAFVDTELDDGDLTYFVIYKMNIIERSLEQLIEHLREQEARLRESEQILRGSSTLNLRQRLIIEHALRHPQTHYTVKSHMNSNGISTNTARADLDGLARKKLLMITKRSREIVYLAAPDLAVRVKAKPRRGRS